MSVIYLVLFIGAAVCFVIAALVEPRRVNASTPGPSTVVGSFGVNLVAMGLFLWVLVPLIQRIVLLSD